MTVFVSIIGGTVESSSTSICSPGVTRDFGCSDRGCLGGLGCTLSPWCFSGEQERDRERIGDMGGFLKSSRGRDEEGGNNGTDWDLALPGLLVGVSIAGT